MEAYDSNVTDEGYTPTSLLQNINVLVAFHHGKNMSMEIGSASSILFADGHAAGITRNKTPFKNYFKLVKIYASTAL